MEKKPNSRKKIIIAAVLASVLLIGAIVSVVLVLAAPQQYISSNIKISYSVDGVGAKVSAKYGVIAPDGSVEMAAMTTSDGVSEYLEFSVADGKVEGASLTPNGDIVLSQTAGTEVVFEYKFENIAETAFTVGLTATGDDVKNYNIVERYYVSANPLETNKYGKIDETTLAPQAVMNLEDVLYVYVKVAVDNINKSAAYEKAYKWSLDQITASEVVVTLNNNGGSNGLSSIDAAVGYVAPVLSTLPTAPSGQGFVGYFDAATGGTQYISKNGVGIKNIESAITL